MRRLLQSRPLMIWSVEPDELVGDALRLMSDKDIGALLVKEKGRVVGIVTERDITRKLVLQGRSCESTRISEIMTERVFYVSMHQTVDECMALMIENHLRHLPVIEDECVVGIISMRDMIAELVMEKAFLIEQLENYIHTVPPYHAI
ncbi:MAG: CBS domain-containing protein [Oscillochloris sp.]|nr:CBS domain-containing protein [Oscillochloris sp.]